MNKLRFFRRGFTLIEMLVVITIIIALAAILVPLLARAQVQAQAAKCGAKARAIAVTVVSYSPNWKGWTNPDGAGYVADFGYKLRTDPGYNAGEAKGVKDFKCTLDTKPLTNGHGCPISYSVTSAYVGQNVMNNFMDPSRSIAVLEMVKRHPGDRTTMERHYVFGDTRYQLGSSKGQLNGLAARFWNQGGGNWSLVKANTYTALPDFETVWAKDMTETNFGFLPQTGKPGNWGIQIGNLVDSILVRMDGYIEFPSAGTWYIVSYSDEWSLFWVDLDGNGTMSGAESGETTLAGQYIMLKTYNGIIPDQLYKCAFMFMEGGTANYFNFYRSQDKTVVTNPRGGGKEIIPISSLRFNP